jgi:hypothetical protein
VTIVAYRSVQELEDLLGGQRITGVQMVDGNVETYFSYNGQPRKIVEEPQQVFGALRLEGATLAGAELRGNRICYTLSSVERARTPGGFLQAFWLERDNRLRTLTGVRLASDGVDYGVEDSGRADVVHETGAWVLGSLRITGVRLTDADLDAGDVVYSLAAA